MHPVPGNPWVVEWDSCPVEQPLTDGWMCYTQEWLDQIHSEAPATQGQIDIIKNRLDNLNHQIDNLNHQIDTLKYRFDKLDLEFHPYLGNHRD